MLYISLIPGCKQPTSKSSKKISYSQQWNNPFGNSAATLNGARLVVLTVVVNLTHLLNPIPTLLFVFIVVTWDKNVSTYVTLVVIF